MDIEFIICVTLEDGSKEELIMWVDEECDDKQLLDLAHEKVMNKFGDYRELEIR